MNRHDDRMHRGIGRERELERLRNQQFQGQYSNSQRLQDLEAGPEDRPSPSPKSPRSGKDRSRH